MPWALDARPGAQSEAKHTVDRQTLSTGRWTRKGISNRPRRWPAPRADSWTLPSVGAAGRAPAPGEGGDSCPRRPITHHSSPPRGAGPVKALLSLDAEVEGSSSQRGG